MTGRGTRRPRRLRWSAALILVVVTTWSAAPAQAVPTSAYAGQGEQALATGGAPPFGYGTPAAGVPGTGSGGGLPFSAFDILLIIGGSGLILVSGAGFGRMLAERQRIGHP
jgi:hypothetical protein